jgi:large subunit ribosomal protein L10
MNREQKETAVAELATELGEAQAIFAVDYRGISVPQAAELRAELRGADTAFRVVKNRLTLRAADKAGTEPLKDWLVGPTALALVRGDAALAAKALSKLGSEFNVLSYKGGLMDGEVLAPDDFKAIAKLPGRDQLNAQFAGMVASPLVGLVRGLGSMISGLALQLGQIAEQGLVTGEAPPARTEEAVADEPVPEAETSAEDEAPEEDQPEETSSEAPDEDSASPAAASQSDTPAGEAEEVAVDVDKTEPEANAEGEAGDSKEPSTNEPEPADPGREAEESAVDNEEDE